MKKHNSAMFLRLFLASIIIIGLLVVGRLLIVQGRIKPLVNILPDSFPQTFRSQKPAQYVPEANTNVGEKNNIEIGGIVDFSKILPGKQIEELIFTEDAKNHHVIVLNRQGEIIKKITVGKEPHDITVSPDQRFVVTGNFGDGTISIINTRTLLVEKTIKTGGGAHGVAFSPDGNFLFVANAKDNTLSIIETGTFSNQKEIIIGSFPEYVGVTKDGSKIFTTNLAGNGSVTILENNGFESRIIKTIDLGIDPHGWALSPDGSKVVITNLGSNLTYLLDADTFEEVSHIDTRAATEFAAFKDNTELWLTNIGAHYVSIVDIEQNKIIGQIEVGETPHGISFSFDKTLAFVPLHRPGEIVIIDVAKRKIVKKVKIGDELHNAVVVKLRK